MLLWLHYIIKTKNTPLNSTRAALHNLKFKTILIYFIFISYSVHQHLTLSADFLLIGCPKQTNYLNTRWVELLCLQSEPCACSERASALFDIIQMLK